MFAPLESSLNNVNVNDNDNNNKYICCCYLYINTVYFAQINKWRKMPFDYFTHDCGQNFRPFLALCAWEPNPNRCIIMFRLTEYQTLYGRTPVRVHQFRSIYQSYRQRVSWVTVQIQWEQWAQITDWMGDRWKQVLHTTSRPTVVLTCRWTWATAENFPM